MLEERAEASDSSSCRRAPCISPSSPKILSASGVHVASPDRHCSASDLRSSSQGRRRREHAAHYELWSHRAVPAVLVQPKGDVDPCGRLQPVEVRPEPERDRRAAVAALLADAEAEMLALAHRARAVASTLATSSMGSGLPRPNGREPCELLRQIERELACRDDGVDHGERPEVDVGEHGVGVAAECGRERLQAFRGDQPGGGTVAAEAVEVLGARAETGVEVEAGDRAARPLPALAARR